MLVDSLSRHSAAVTPHGRGTAAQHRTGSAQLRPLVIEIVHGVVEGSTCHPRSILPTWREEPIPRAAPWRRFTSFSRSCEDPRRRRG